MLNFVSFVGLTRLDPSVIPRIRKLCAERDVLLSVVDLRWGVTDAAAGQRKSLA
jgi:hypothetical protein